MFRYLKSIRIEEIMLRFMRRHATGYMVKIIFGAIIVVFIFWGVGSFREREKVVAEVGSYKIYFAEYQEEYNRMLNLYKILYKDRLDETMLRELRLNEKAIDELVNRYLLLIKAEEIGIGVSGAEFTRHIQGIEMFKRGGKFSPEVYMEVLRRNNIDPKRFEVSERQMLAISKLIRIINDNCTFISESDAWLSYTKENGSINLLFVEFDPVRFRSMVKVDERELMERYEREKGQYKGENLYSLAYIIIDMNTGVKDDEAYMDLLKAKDIATYAKEKGIKLYTLTDIAESEINKRFGGLKVTDIIKGLKKGDITLPLRVDGKSYIFQLTAFKEGRLPDKEIVLKEIKERLIDERARRMAMAEAEEAIAKKDFLRAMQTGLFPRNKGVIPKLGKLPSEHMDLLRLSTDNPIYKRPVELSGKYYIFSLKDELPPDKKEWEKVKKAYVDELMRKKREEFITRLLADLKREYKVKIDLPS
jgi:hypothetical protein